MPRLGTEQARRPSSASGCATVVNSGSMAIAQSTASQVSGSSVGSARGFLDCPILMRIRVPNRPAIWATDQVYPCMAPMLAAGAVLAGSNVVRHDPPV
jgi:hypothetical protein